MLGGPLTVTPFSANALMYGLDVIGRHFSISKTVEQMDDSWLYLLNVKSFQKNYGLVTWDAGQKDRP